jgi:ribosomal protein S18 acetylase RimI-like enzyme
MSFIPIIVKRGYDRNRGVKKLFQKTFSKSFHDMVFPVPEQTKHSVEYRVAVRADLAAIVALLNDDEFGAARNPLFHEEPDAYLSAFDRIEQDPSNRYIVAWLDGRIVGCYQLTFIVGLSHAGGERAQIESVRIASDLRGAGLGTELMRDALDRARARGCFLVQLTTDVRRAHTKCFYERLGFVATHNGMKLKL